ncbi:hypothetical protein ADUPG1_004929, partial [Aduncisulcus paluster]
MKGFPGKNQTLPAVGGVGYVKIEEDEHCFSSVLQLLAHIPSFSNFFSTRYSYLMSLESPIMRSEELPLLRQFTQLMTVLSCVDSRVCPSVSIQPIINTMKRIYPEYNDESEYIDPSKFLKDLLHALERAMYPITHSAVDKADIQREKLYVPTPHPSHPFKLKKGYSYDVDSLRYSLIPPVVSTKCSTALKHDSKPDIASSQAYSSPERSGHDAGGKRRSFRIRKERVSGSGDQFSSKSSVSHKSMSTPIQTPQLQIPPMKPPSLRSFLTCSIVDLFRGVTGMDKICTVCDYQGNTINDTLVYTIPLIFKESRSSGKSSSSLMPVITLIRQHLSSDKGFKGCSKCGKNVMCSYCFKTLPEIFMVHIQRKKEIKGKPMKYFVNAPISP